MDFFSEASRIPARDLGRKVFTQYAPECSEGYAKVVWKGKQLSCTQCECLGMGREREGRPFGRVRRGQWTNGEGCDAGNSTLPHGQERDFRCPFRSGTSSNYHRLFAIQLGESNAHEVGNPQQSCSEPIRHRKDGSASETGVEPVISGAPSLQLRTP